MSKYASVDEAVKWSVRVLKIASNHKGLKNMNMDWLNTDDMLKFNRNREEIFTNFAVKLETRLVREIDNKVTENSGISKHARNLLSPYSFKERTSVNLQNALNQTIIELGFPPFPEFFVTSFSEVSPKHFMASSFFSGSIKNVEAEYNGSIRQKKEKNTQTTLQKPKKQGLPR